MYHSLAVHVYQPPGDVFELSEAIVSNGCDQSLEQNPTSSGRFASLLALINSLMFPFTIHSDAIAKWRASIVTPNRCSTFGWRRAFHVTTSLQNLYNSQRQQVNTFSNKLWKPTFEILSKSLLEEAPNTLTATWRPCCSPFHTSAYPPRYNGRSNRL